MISNKPNSNQVALFLDAPTPTFQIRAEGWQLEISNFCPTSAFVGYGWMNYWQVTDLKYASNYKCNLNKYMPLIHWPVSTVKDMTVLS